MQDYKELRARELERLAKQTDPEVERLATVVRALLGATARGMRVYVYGPYHHKRTTRISVWEAGPTGDLILALQIGRRHLMEAYVPRRSATKGRALLEALGEAFSLSPSIQKALERWTEGRTLASKGFDHA